MFLKLFIFLQFICVIGLKTSSEEHNVKAWIEIEGELNALSVRAKIKNNSTENLFLNYEIEMHSRSRIKNQKTLQKGKLFAMKESVINLGESRLNVKRTEELCVLIKVLHDSEVVAVDSVIFHRR